MAKKIINDSTLTAIADAIREKTGDSAAMTPLEMPTEIENIPTGGADENFVKFLEQDNTNYLTQLTTEVVLPEGLTKIHSYAFYQSRLKKVTVPTSVHEIYSNTFDTAGIADGVVFKGEITSISTAGFRGFRCLPETDITISGSTSEALKLIGGSTFQSMTGCNKLTLGNPTYGVYCGYMASVCSGCTDLKEAEIYVHNIVIQTSSFFQNCSSLEKIKMSMSEHVSNSTQGFGSNFFANCTACLEYDFTGYRVVPSLANTNAFTGINANAKIVVPDDLYDDWIAATNWATYASYIVKESDYVQS